MSKAEELLERWLKNSPSDVDLFIYRDTRNYLNRKDKLVEGSEWECAAVCLVAEISSKAKLTSTLTVLGDVCLFVGNDDLMSTIKVKDKHYIIPISQFLLCFKPIEKGKSE